MANDWWSEFSNNLATDLAPLISLFGEAPTKQYLSECLNMTDIIIFSMAPLGIITIVVSAIRVCGTPSLRAFIGRAQEGAGNAEAELCSSTSREVCELYNNGGIARVFGRPKLLEIVLDPNATNDDFYQKGPNAQATAGIYSFKDYLKKDKQEWEEIGKPARDEEKESMSDDADTERDFAINPNLSLNVGIKQGTRLWFTAAAILGILLQSSVLVWAAIARYKFNDVKKDLQDAYAVPLTVIGTFFLCSGAALCASLIESSTKERVFTRKIKKDGSKERSASQVYWVQPGTQFVGDQAFDSFAYTHPKGGFTPIHHLLEDREERTQWDLVGFLLQFLGLRACHSSVAVAQLGVTLVMSVVRSMLRANRISEEEVSLAHKPDLYKGHELDWLALNLGSEPKPNDAEPEFKPEWTVSPAPYHTADISEIGWKLLGPTSSMGNQPFPDERTEFRRMFVVHAGNCILSGFRLDRGESIRQQGNTSEYQQPEDWWDSCLEVDKAWQSNIKLVPERWRAAVQSKLALDKVTGVQDGFAKAFMYRARLARLSDGWDEKLVSVRNAARILAMAIESTMHVISTTDIRLEKGWSSAFTLFWAIQCNLGEDNTNGNIYLSLTREIDKNGHSGGVWRVNESELEAVLGLWLWSLRSMGTKMQTPLKRILSVKPHSATGKDPTADFNLWREGGSSSIEETDIELNQQTRPLFGRNNVLLKYHTSCTVLEIAADTRSLPIMCAQEIYSLFFSSIVHAIKSIGGKTDVQRSDGIGLANTNISKIQNSFMESGLGSVGDAFTCIFPALILQGKLPLIIEALSTAKEAADIYISEERWEEAEKLLSWALSHSQQPKMTSKEEKYQTKEELLNHQRLLTLSLCECYRKAMLSGEIEFCLNGIITILNKSTLNELEKILLIARDNPKQEEITELGGRSDRRGNEDGKAPFTLADVVNSYGIAVIRIVYSKFRDRVGGFESRIETLRSMLNDRGKPVQNISLENVDHNTTTRSKQKGILLFQAIRDYQLDDTLYLLDKESAIEDGVRGGKSLSFATQHGWSPVVKSLVDYGAAFEWNASYGHVTIMKKLLNDRRVDPKLKDNDGKTPLSIAAENGHREAVELLLSIEGVEVEFLDNHLRSPLSLAAMNGHSDVVNLLLTEQGVIVDSTDDISRTPLSYAAGNGHISVVRFLLADRRIRPNLTDKDGKSALSWAACNGHDEVVKLLLSYKEIEPDSRDTMGRTPFFNAAQSGHYKVVEILGKEKGVDVNSSDILDDVPLFLAKWVNCTTKCRRLDLNAEGPIDNTPLCWAAKMQDREVAELLINDYGVDINAGGNDGNPLVQAAEHCDLQMMKLLLSREEIKVDIPDDEGLTALLLSVARTRHPDSFEATRLLLEKGANVNAKTIIGWTSFHMAAAQGVRRMFDMVFTAEGLELNPETSDGLTPLDFALNHGRVEIAELMKKKGCRPGYGKKEVPAEDESSI
ncbi:pfs [Microsporum canis CBS 113480]|uniref:Pfs n=1 Tax=Arthroderma otae (strain ATCC MYA-4605 / CBS 113480) TaxID=554155 RepID=C5FHK2_ARTOC|nr:pfs [Microsporum canis CBS 113480]EEQ28742.1 pfs [Microsporum canis CBS 113480]